MEFIGFTVFVPEINKLPSHYSRRSARLCIIPALKAAADSCLGNEAVIFNEIVCAPRRTKFHAPRSKINRERGKEINCFPAQQKANDLGRMGTTQMKFKAAFFNSLSLSLSVTRLR
jgi:hypothetical protein